MLFVGTAGTSNSNLKPQPTNSTLDVKSLEIEMAEAKLNPSATSGPNLSGRTKEEQTSIVEDDILAAIEEAYPNSLTIDDMSRYPWTQKVY